MKVLLTLILTFSIGSLFAIDISNYQVFYMISEKGILPEVEKEMNLHFADLWEISEFQIIERSEMKTYQKPNALFIAITNHQQSVVISNSSGGSDYYDVDDYILAAYYNDDLANPEYHSFPQVRISLDKFLHLPPKERVITSLTMLQSVFEPNDCNKELLKGKTLLIRKGDLNKKIDAKDLEKSFCYAFRIVDDETYGEMNAEKLLTILQNIYAEEIGSVS